MSKSTGILSADKPRKPYPDFPLFPHATGRWAKKIKQRLCYFGKWRGEPYEESWQAALELYKQQAEDLHAGRKPRPKTDQVTVADACNHFLNRKRQAVNSGELSERSFADYYRTAERLIQRLGKHRLVTDLDMRDFEQLRDWYTKKWNSPVTVSGEITRTRVLFGWVYESGLVDRPIRFGVGFKKPSKKVLRQQKQQNGKRLFSAEEIRLLLDKADEQMHAMILLGINCGLGNSDLGGLELKHLDLEGGWLNYPRPKTAIERRSKLWPETVEALRKAIAHRRPALLPADKNIVFLTHQGRRWCRTTELAAPDSKHTGGTPADMLGREFGKLRDEVMKKRGCGFYSLRHSLQTVADATKDPVAIMRVMGHHDASMSATYREAISDARLKAVVETVHRWLFPADGEAEKE